MITETFEAFVTLRMYYDTRTFMLYEATMHISSEEHFIVYLIFGIC